MHIHTQAAFVLYLTSLSSLAGLAVSRSGSGWTGGRFLGGLRSDIESTILSLDTVDGGWAECYLGVGSAFHCPLVGSLESIGGDFVEFAPTFRWSTFWL